MADLTRRIIAVPKNEVVKPKKRKRAKARSRKTIALLLGFAISLPASLSAQSDSTLKGITRVSAEVTLLWSNQFAFTGVSEAQARGTVESKFTLELRKLGVIVSDGAPSKLACRILTWGTQGVPPGNLAVHTEIVLSEPVLVRRLNRTMQAETWSGFASFGMFLPGNIDAQLEKEAVFCVEKFGNAWLAANPKRTN